MKFKEAKKYCDWGVLYWADPEQLVGNDYRVTSIVKIVPGLVNILYNNGQSEAEVFLHELYIKQSLS